VQGLVVGHSVSTLMPHYPGIRIVISVCGDLIDNETRFMENRSEMLKLTAYLNRCRFQGAIEAEGLGSRRALAVIGAIPFPRRIGNLTRTPQNPETGLGHGRGTGSLGSVP
jgi:hypothetical protein